MVAHSVATQSPVIGRPVLAQPGISFIPQGNERVIGRNDLEGGGFVAIVAFGEIETEEALDEAEDIIQRKRRELARRKARVNTGPSVANVRPEKPPDWDDESA